LKQYLKYQQLYRPIKAENKNKKGIPRPYGYLLFKSKLPDILEFWKKVFEA
jgi:hypothetical protein